MAWTTPRTWRVGETPTYTLLNTHLRDNLDFLYSPPSCRVYNSANISTSTGGFTALTFDSERWDTDTMHSAVSNTGRITATTAGRYLIIGQVQWAAHATGYREARVEFNGAGIYPAWANHTVSSASIATHINVVGQYPLAASEYITLAAYQNSGGALNVAYSTYTSPEFMAHWIGGT